MDEAELCDRVALIQGGQILKVDTPKRIEHSYNRPLFSIRDSRQYEILQELRGRGTTHSIFAFGDVLHYSDARQGISRGDVSQLLQNAGFTGAIVSHIDPGVEDVFMELMDDPQTLETE